MRRTKDAQVPKCYYHPESLQCPHCGQALKRAYPVWRKFIVFLSGRYQVINVGYHCVNARCGMARTRRVYTSQVAERLTLRGSSFALEVIVQIGVWRFGQHWTITQIHHELTQAYHLPISEREVLYLIEVFLVLNRSTYAQRIEAHAAEFMRPGVYLAIDALKPEKGNTALYVVRDLKYGLVLHEVSLLGTDQRALVMHLLRPVQALGYRVRGIVSDDERALRPAVAQVFPATPHQTCQLHCLRDAGVPIMNDDRAFKTDLKKAIRGPFYAACRTLERQHTPSDPRYAVLQTYAELIRSTLTEGGKAPFELGGLRVYEDLARLEASLKRSRKRGAIRSWRSSWRWCSAAALSRCAIANSNANGIGWWSWTGASTRQMSRSSHVLRRDRSSAKSVSSWLNSSNRRKRILRMPQPSRISVPPLSSVGPDCSRAMPGRSAIGATMTWKPSLGACAPASAKLMGASRSTSSWFAMVSGLYSSILTKRAKSCCNASSALTKRVLIRSLDASRRHNGASRYSTAFATSRASV